MKTKTLLLVLFSLFLSAGLSAQHRRGSTANFNSGSSNDSQKSYNNGPVSRKVEVGLIGGYQFGGKLYTYNYGEVKIADGVGYGATMSFPIPVKWNSRIELSFMNQKTSVSYRDPQEGYTKTGISVRYYQIGMVKEFPKGKAIPYGVFSLGASQIDPEDNHNSEEWAFAINLGGGLKYYITDIIGIKIEGKIMAPIQFGGLYFGVGSGGTSSGVSAGSYTMQGYIGGGLTLNLVR